MADNQNAEVWTPSDDANLVALKDSGLNWAPIMEQLGKKSKSGTKNRYKMLKAKQAAEENAGETNKDDKTTTIDNDKQKENKAASSPAAKVASPAPSHKPTPPTYPAPPVSKPSPSLNPQPSPAPTHKSSSAAGAKHSPATYQAAPAASNKGSPAGSHKSTALPHRASSTSSNKAASPAGSIKHSSPATYPAPPASGSPKPNPTPAPTHVSAIPKIPTPQLAKTSSASGSGSNGNRTSMSKYIQPASAGGAGMAVPSGGFAGHSAPSGNQSPGFRAGPSPMGAPPGPAMRFPHGRSHLNPNRGSPATYSTNQQPKYGHHNNFGLPVNYGLYWDKRQQPTHSPAIQGSRHPASDVPGYPQWFRVTNVGGEPFHGAIQQGYSGNVYLSTFWGPMYGYYNPSGYFVMVGEHPMDRDDAVYTGPGAKKMIAPAAEESDSDNGSSGDDDEEEDGEASINQTIAQYHPDSKNAGLREKEMKLLVALDRKRKMDHYKHVASDFYKATGKKVEPELLKTMLEEEDDD